jgi:hypothetical protein
MYCNAHERPASVPVGSSLVTMSNATMTTSSVLPIIAARHLELVLVLLIYN